MRTALSFLAGRRWAGVGLALLSELVLLVVLSLAPASATLGLPAAVAAAIAGTVAVVFGVADGVAVAMAGAVAFGALSGWGAGELAAIGVWPLIVAAVGLFARRIERQRAALRHLVEAQEDERRSLALTLHDDSAQTLTGALLTLRSGLAGSEPAAAQTLQARELITDTIRQLRRLAVELSPKALEDYGLASALGHLAEMEGDLHETPIEFTYDWDGRLPRDAEWALFRFAQAGLAVAHESRGNPITIRLAYERGRVAVSVTAPVLAAEAPPTRLPTAVEERVRLLDGRVSATLSGSSGRLVLRADVPGQLRLAEHAASVA
ncbi:MAG TPA: histidine kinase [Gaiellaceae bacterium]|nr:histidine kinase [Gaiellaceae bacterium]